MRILVFSDSHGTMEHMFQAVRKEHPDYILHLGDKVSDAEYLRLKNPETPVLIVRGNCDTDVDYPDERCIMLNGKKILMCHGHRFHVKAGLLSGRLAAMEQNADIFLYGHTHEPFYEQVNGLDILNPGACGSEKNPTYGRITLSDGKILCQIIHVED